MPLTSPEFRNSLSGVNTTYTWNSAYQPTSSQAGTAGTSRSYYAATGCPGAVSSTVDAKGNTTSYTYDSRCRLVTTTPPAPLGKVTQTWDVNDQVATSTDGAGNKQAFTYDAMDRVTKVTYYAPGATTSTSSVTYTYDAAGNTTKQTDVNGSVTTTTSRTLDSRNRVTSETLPKVGGTSTYTNSYTYDRRGNVKSMTTPDGVTTYSYDGDNRVSSITPPAGAAITYTYENNTQVAIHYPNGTVDIKHVDTAGRVLQVEQYRTSDSANFHKIDYSYVNPNDPNHADTDKVYSANDSVHGVTDTITYDALGRVASEQGTGKDFRYAYDDNGNRTSWSAYGYAGTAVYNGADEMTSYTDAGNFSGTSTPTYDATGAQLTNATQDVYKYDLRQRVASAKSGSALSQDMSYTGQGNDDRLAAGSRTFASSILGVVSQTDSGNTTRFIRDPAGDVLGQIDPNGSIYYYLTDRLGSTLAITDSTGYAFGGYGYGPYGEYAYGSDLSQTKVYWLYAGAYREADAISTASLYKMGTRYYNPDIGRFTQPDFSGQEANKYAYAGDDPLNSTDPTGEASLNNLLSRFLKGAGGLGDILELGQALASGDDVKIFAAIEGIAVGNATEGLCSAVVAVAGLATGGLGLALEGVCFLAGYFAGNYAAKKFSDYYGR